jgi:putative ABC transport system ATP-binding protein
LIEIVDVTKTFNAGQANEFTAIRNLTLTLSAEQIIVLKGPSGSGKTTLLTMIGCMARPTSGRINLLGREITSLPERFLSRIRRETFGFVFQNFNLVRGMTALENVMVAAYPMAQPHTKVKNRALKLLDQAGIASKSRQRVEHLSGGEQQRTAIARALINDPSIIIADEPTAHLDTELSKEFMSSIQFFKSQNKSLIITSHDPLVFESAAVDRVIEMRDGVIVGKGSGQ